MPTMFAALLLSAALSRPDLDDDDRPRRQRPPVSAGHRDGDDAAPKHWRDHDDDGDADGDEHAQASPVAAGPAPTGGAEKDGVDDRAASAADADDEDEGAVPASAIVVTARRLDEARTRIDTGLGATVYALTNDAIEVRPGGETGSVADVLAQAPGVTLSGQTLNVRGVPANQVRINNVVVPEAISDPADQLSARLAQTTRLITGTLPAQYGFAPAGVISITTKNGLYQHGGQAEFFAGSDGMVEPALEWAGSTHNTSLFASGSIEHDRTTVGDATGLTGRDRRAAVEGLGFADHVIDEDNRVSFIVGGSHERHRFAGTGIGPGTGTRDDGYGVATYQHSSGGFTVQASVFGGVASDEVRFADRTRERRSSWGTQIDGSTLAGKAHTLRFGLLFSRADLRELARNGAQSRDGRSSLALYAQDEWTVAPGLTFNPGLRIEWLRGLAAKATAEPRASMVWAPTGTLAVHAGYARYAAAPALGEQPSGPGPADERDDYFDAGIQQKLGAFTIGLDGYWRSAHDYIVERQIIGSALPEAFGFRRARMKGLELSGAYARGGTTAWANLSLTRSEAQTIVGDASLFPAASLAAAATGYVALASDRPVTASAGFTQRIEGLTLSGDVLVSSGAVRTAAAANPNGGRRAAYAVVNLAAVYHVPLADRYADIRLDLTNLADAGYATSDATTLEGGWTRWGHGRAIAIGVELGF